MLWDCVPVESSVTRMNVFTLLCLLMLASRCDADCIWYGQCGFNSGIARDKMINCKYSGPPKPFATQEGLEKFKANCPSLYTGPGVKTCCSDDQMLTLNDQVAFPRQSLHRCPSCFHNFMNLWCYLTCGPKQSEFMSINTTKPYVTPDNKTVDAIVSVEYVVGTDSAVGMLNSCRNVQMPSSNEPALSLLCGEDADTCTPQKWLDYMGTIQDGQAPFDIHFHISSQNLTFNNTVLKPLDMKPVPCYQAVSNTSGHCNCKDCPVPLCTPSPVLIVPRISQIFRTENVIVSRPNNNTVVTWKNRNYTNIFDLTFLHEVLDLQLAIANISTVHDNRNITIEDICFAPLSPDNNNCSIQSVLNYFQNSHEMLDKVAYDDYGWFVMANYLDHFEYCVEDPYSANDTTKLHTPCIGTFGGPVYPSLALRDYMGDEYMTARAFVITFLMNNYTDPIRRKQIKAWEKEFWAFMKNYKTLHPSTKITYFSQGPKLIHSQETIDLTEPARTKKSKPRLLWKQKNQLINNFEIHK